MSFGVYWELMQVAIDWAGTGAWEQGMGDEAIPNRDLFGDYIILMYTWITWVIIRYIIRYF